MNLFIYILIYNKLYTTFKVYLVNTWRIRETIVITNGAEPNKKKSLLHKYRFALSDMICKQKLNSLSMIAILCTFHA